MPPVTDPLFCDWAGATGMGPSRTNKGMGVEMTKAPYRLGRLLINSPKSWHSWTERTLLVTLCLLNPSLFNRLPDACHYLYLLDSRDQREHSYWSQSQALRTQDKMKGKPRQIYGFPPSDKQHKRQITKESHDYLWMSGILNKSLPKLLCPKNQFTQIYIFFLLI